MVGGVGHTGGLTNPAPGAEDAEPVILMQVGLPCLKRGRLLQKSKEQNKSLTTTITTTTTTTLCVAPLTSNKLTERTDHKNENSKKYNKSNNNHDDDGLLTTSCLATEVKIVQKTSKLTMYIS